MGKKRAKRRRDAGVRADRGPSGHHHNEIDADEIEAFVAGAVLRHLEAIGPERFAELLLALPLRAEHDPGLAELLPVLLSDAVRDELSGRSAEDLRSSWDTLSEPARALLVHTVVDRVLVAPEPGSAAERATIVWVHDEEPDREEGGDLGPEREWMPADLTAMLANPAYAIQIDPMLALPHAPLLDEETWIEANVRLIDEFGAEAYLRNLLSVLRGNYPNSSG